jgi:cell division topological specificity factor MinE
MKPGTKAKSRLQQILEKDRSVLSPGTFRILKKELGTILAKYFDVDKRKIKLLIEENTGDGYHLSADLPLKPSAKSEGNE